MSQRRQALIDGVRVVTALACTTWLVHVGDRRRVAHATNLGMNQRRTSQAEINARALDVWRSVRMLCRIKRYWPAEVACLQTALTLQRVLVTEGISATLRIGVPSEGQERVSAHAWLEVGDLIIDDQAIADSFLPLEHRTTAARDNEGVL
jgi:hypothetical protein